MRINDFRILLVCVLSQHMKIQPYEPTVATVRELSPDTRYAIYVGGVQASGEYFLCTKL